MSELEHGRALTGRAFLTGLVLAMVWLLYDCTLAVDPALSGIDVLYLIGFGAVFTMFVVQFFNNLLDERKRLSTRELTVIYAMVAVTIPWGILIRAALEAPIKRIVFTLGTRENLSGQWLTSWWATKSRDAIELFRMGGKKPWEIPWGEWAKPICYWSAMLLSFQVFAISVVLFFRRIFIDEEKLPFPLASVGQSIIEYRPSKSEETSARRLRTSIRIAFLVGLLICTPGILGITPDSTPDIPMESSYYGTQTGIITGLSVRLSWDPFVLCFLMFFPVDVLFTAGVFWVGLSIVVPVICRWLGVPAPPVSDYRLDILGMGGLIGLAFWTVFFNRRKIRDAFRRASPGTDADEPLRFRTVLVVMVVSFAVFAVLLVAGIGDIRHDLFRHVLSLLLVTFMLVTLLVATMRMSGEQGWHYHSPWWYGMTMTYVHGRYMTVPAPLMHTPASYLTISHLFQFGPYHNVFGPHLHVLNSLKIARATGAAPRDVMKAVLLILLIVLVVAVPLYLMLIHYYGFDRARTSDRWYNGFWNYEQPQGNIAYQHRSSIFNRINPLVSIPIGVALIGFIMYMRRERVGFPLSPVGVVVAGMGNSYFGHYSTQIIWLPILMVLVVKHVIYRWFGVRFFREKVIPVVLFAMMGLMTGQFIYRVILASMGRGFLRPY